MAIDIHAHFFPASVLKEIDRGESKLGVSYSESDRVLTFGSRRARPLFDALVDLEARRKWNAERQISLQVLSPWMDVAGDELTDGDAVAWAALYNDGVASEIDGAEGFVAFAALPVHDGDAAAAELTRSVDELGFAGGALPTQVQGRNLDEGGLEPLFEAAQGLDVPLFLHPFRVLGADRLQRDFMNNVCGNPFETTVAAMSLFFGGVFERFPQLRVLLSHGGGTLPLIAGRAAHASRHNGNVRRRVDAPDEILEHFYYDTLLHDVAALAFVIARVGAERVALGTDVPFPMAVDEPVDHLRTALDRAGLSAMLDRVAGGSAGEILPSDLVPVRDLH